MGDPPLISVVIPCYRAAGTLPDALESVLVQDHPDVEIIAVDDGSPDGTSSVLVDYGDQITALRIANSGGPARPRNVGVARARGELVALLDADDVMRPGKLSAQAAVLAALPEVDLVCTDFRQIDADGTVLNDSCLAEYRGFRRLLRPCGLPDVSLLSGYDLHHELLRGNFVGTSSVVVRRSRLRAAGGFDETLRNGDDIDMWLKLSRDGAVFAFLDRPLHDYRVNDAGISARGWRRLPSVIRVRERQLAHVTDPEMRRFLHDRLLYMRLGYAWGLRGDGRYAEALPAYREAIAQRWTWSGFKGLLMTRVLALLRGRG
jgi:glycosyltransferase involved in cell wall biosynthesis